MTQANKLTRFAATTGAALLFAGVSFAGDKCIVIDDKCPVESDPFAICDIFDYMTLYDNEDNCLIQKVKLQGRYHGQWENVDASHEPGQAGTGAGYTDFSQWEHRRARVGAKVQFLNDFEFAFNINTNGYSGGNADGLYRGDYFDHFEDITIVWKPEDFFFDKIAVGKMKNKITREESISSNDIITLERSHFVNSYNAARPWGIEFSKEIGAIDHKVGFFTTNAYDTNQTVNPNEQREDWRWLSFDEASGMLATYNAAMDLGDCLGTLHFDYQYSNWSPWQGAVDAGGANGLQNQRYLGSVARHVAALGYVQEFTDNCDNEIGGILLDIQHANDIAGFSGVVDRRNNATQGRNAWGFTVLPHYNINDKLQLVGRWAYASLANDENPFDNTEFVPGFGNHNSDWVEDIHTFYVGLNYYICGNNLKLMAGYEYANAQSIDNPNVFGAPSEYEAGAWSLAVRTKW